MELQEESGRYGVGQVVKEIAGVYHHIIQELCERNISAPIKLCEAFVGRKSRVKKKCMPHCSLDLKIEETGHA